MTTKSPVEQDASFDLVGPAGALRIDVGGGMIRIVKGKVATSIPQEHLLRIEHCPVSWRFGSSRPGLWIRFLYGNGGHPQKTEIVVAADDPRTSEFVRDLKYRFPDEALLEPREDEKTRILSKGHRGSYGLHAMHILTPAGIVLGILLLCVLVLLLILAESMPARTVSGGTLKQAMIFFLCLAMIPAALMTLIARRFLMTLRTDPKGLTIRRVFSSRRFAWRDVKVGEPRFDAFNIYRGMFCYCSDRIDVVSSRHFVEIPLRRSNRIECVLRLNLEEATPFIRELYYRNKMTLETARKTGAFL